MLKPSGLCRTVLAVALALAAACIPATAEAAPRPVNLLVVTEDADMDTVPRDNRIYNRVQNELSEVLNLRGYQVYDETAVGMAVTAPHRVRRQDAELIDVARAVNPPIDGIVVYQIYASVTRSQYSDIERPAIRIAGRVLNARTGQFIGSFEVGGFEFAPLTLGCAADRECLLEAIGKEARRIAGDLGAALSDKLDGFIAAPAAAVTTADTAPASPAKATAPVAAPGCDGMPTAYVIKLQGFEVAEMQKFENYAVYFGCYIGHRVVSSGRTYTDYWYETSSDSARLTNNINTAIQSENLLANVSLRGNVIEVAKVATR